MESQMEAPHRYAGPRLGRSGVPAVREGRRHLCAYGGRLLSVSAKRLDGFRPVSYSA